MRYTYKTNGTCSRMITFDIDGDIVTNVKFEGGCSGNTQGVARLVEGLTVAEIEKRCSEIKCGMKNTSCPDQLARAVREAYNNK